MQFSSARPQLRRPRLRVLANGAFLPGVQSARVCSNNHYAADRFGIVVASGALEAQDVADLASRSELNIEISVSLDGASGFESLMQGAADAIRFDPLQGVLRIEGRDLTASLVESRMQETFSNRTSSEIAQILAERHGLRCEAEVTRTPVGRYYGNESDRIALGQFSRAMTEWDLLTFLAQQEGFDAYVEKSTLFFQPTRRSADAVLFRPSDFTDVCFSRSLVLAKDIEVTVKSWNTRQQAAFSESARTESGGKPRSGPAQKLLFVRPNLTVDQARKLAQQRLAELSRHERTFSGSVPGELSLTARSVIQMTGTGTEFDQTYQIDDMERILSSTHGFVQHIRGSNRAPAQPSQSDAG